ncbi:hypothetical protein COL922a_013394 [Colletotrichum nupharicola]|nr:hypothetical protein COL922a_013394 [Colletotrichum nupharicola]
MSTPNRSLPGWGEPQRPSQSSAYRVAPQLAPQSGSSQPSDRAPTDAPPRKTEQDIIRSLLFTDDEQFEALSPETQQKVLEVFASLSLLQQVRDSLEGQQRAKQAEANASQAEADLLTGAIHVCEEAKQQAEEEGIEFLHSVSLIDDDVYLSTREDSY